MTPDDLETLARAEPARRRRGRRPPAPRQPTRESILQAAADLASVEGLEGLTIGRLATELGMSKSGLFAHFGSKEELQLATIDAAPPALRRPRRKAPRARSRAAARGSRR